MNIITSMITRLAGNPSGCALAGNLPAPAWLADGSERRRGRQGITALTSCDAFPYPQHVMPALIVNTRAGVPA